ncbi:C2 domain-containing protein [Byssothecium circinans]|uniref:C2 domain-containing protein n=1 Tax=Byssothecium circinans TaxID=147558 RepID=A0A6A5TIL7_9PLEO|nr:C2 domain-containing protein [Byssothecium circinans]
MASSLVDSLTASGGTESAGFLNDIVAQLWPNINVAGCRMVKEIVEPILASTLPGPLSSLRFVKLDLGHVPMRLSEVDVHKTSTGAIKLDMDVTWESHSDIELDGKMVPKIGIEHVHLKGRLSVLLGPLTDIIPLIGAAQVAFINTPELKLDFTNAADVADCSLVSSTIRKTILGIISGMAVLPNRFLVKLDSSNDYFKTYVPHLGVLRLTVEKALGITGPKKSGAKRLLAKIVKDVPDCYCKVSVGAEGEWRTTTKKNAHDPEWNETHDFLVADFEQAITLDVQDDDLGADDDIGIGSIAVKDILLGGGTKEISLTHKGEPTDGRLTVHAKFFHLVSEPSTLSTENIEGGGDGQICGLATVLVASALGLQGQRDELNPSVKVAWGGKEFRTAIKSYSPGTDIFNPSFDQSFRIPVTKDLVNGSTSFKISLLNKENETGTVEIPFEDVLNAADSTVAEAYDVGSGASVRVSISLRGLRLAE